MAISTNGLQLARIAGAVFNQQLSASDYSEILAANKTAAELDAWANAAVAAEFRNKTTTDIAKAVLANVGLSSVAGLEAWVAGQLTAGGGVAKAGATMLAMLNDFSNMTADATYGAAATTFNQKAANSQALSQTAGTATGTYAAVSTATPSAAFTLTTGVDLKTTGAGADTFTSVNPASSTATLTAGDNLNGGAGSDTLAITSAAEITLGAGVTTTDIENITVSASGGTLTLDTALMTGITSVANNGSTAAVSVTGLKALVPVSVTATSANTTVGFASAVTAGTADAITVNINGVGTSLITANGFETINVASSGSASGGSSSSVNGTTVASTTLTTLNVTGTAAAKLVANLAGASAAVTGTLTSDDSGHDIELTGRALTDKLSITMAGGNDTVRIDNMAATHTISGGDGTDTLRYSGAAIVPLASTANVTGIETVTLTNATPASFAMTGAGVTTVNYTTAAAGTFGGLSTGGTIGLNLGGSMTAAAAGAAATATAAATLTSATYSGTADSLTVNVGLATHTTNPGATSSTVSAVGVESVTFNSLAGSGVTEARTVTFADTAATTATLKTITVNGSIPALTTVAVSNTGTSALTTVNLSGVTGGASFTGGATAGTSITGGVGSDVLTGGAGPDNIIGGEGNDTINGAAGADTIDAGNGANNITGGTGADTMTGGSGVDTYVFAPNATTASTVVLTSTTSAPDTITNFTSGVDKISITGAYAPSKFLGNFANIQAALSAQAAAATGLAYAAAFVTSESTLYVFKLTTGLLDADDLAIKMTNVTSLAASDLLLGSQATGNAVTLTAASAVVGQTGASVNTEVNGLSSVIANLTTDNDTVTSQVQFLVGSTLTAGTGTDTLALSLPATTTTWTQANVAIPATVTGFESITLANHTPSSTVTARYHDITLDAANVPTNTTLTVVSSEDGLAFDGSLITSGVIFTASNLAASQPINFTGAAAQDSVTGGSGNDTINGGDGDDTLKAGTGSNSVSGGNGNDSITSASLTDTVDGGAGNDTVIALTGAYTGTLAGGAGVADILQVIASTDIKGGTVSGFETLAIVSANVASSYGMTAAQLSAFTSITTTTVAATNNTIAIDASTTAKATGAITLDVDVINYTVTGAAGVAGVTINGPATSAAFSVTGGVGNDNISLSAATNNVAETLIGGLGNDTITVSAAATDGGTDTIIFGSATVAGNVAASLADTITATAETLILSGVAASTITATLTNVHDVDIITVSGITTGAVALTSANVNTGADLTTVVTTSQTTGALTFNGAAEADGKLNVTGGGGDDILTGGGLADTLSGGAGGDSLTGGAGADSIISGSGNNIINGGTGNDAINLTDGGSDVVRLGTNTLLGVAGTLVPTGIFTDTITGFGVTSDSFQIGIGNLLTAGTVGTDPSIQLSTAAGADINAAIALGAAVVTTAAAGATVDAATATSTIVKFTSATATSFATAIGTGSITISNYANNLATTGNTAAEGLLVTWYDSTNSRAVLSVVVPGNAATAITNATTTVYDVALVGMSAADYASLGTGNFSFIS